MRERTISPELISYILSILPEKSTGMRYCCGVEDQDWHHASPANPLLPIAGENLAPLDDHPRSHATKLAVEQ